ncbi:prolyl oligopeptidase family serine peptidase [Flavobacterium sp. SUN052]|uniref:S9 family peptidase n=1 Tax=Flavobacterium sp. SUN052 TaxID=3002441 RepID=UPI00237DDF94|nr:prolyl oligopeptidase family serine peptidase [Flavobacterium sp. SUN052]MEC4004826.1 prolyl oligopeptidase family serine peptidase [Flavobacterium sp. SUN052]
MFKRVSVSFILFLIACSSYGQANQKRVLLPKDYSLWSTLKTESVSDNGVWTSFSLGYESGLDSLIVQHIGTNKRYVFAKGRQGAFVQDAYFGCLELESTFVLCDLATGKLLKEPNVTAFYVVEHSYLVLITTSESGMNTIKVIDCKGNELISLSDVGAYSLSPDKAVLAYTLVGVPGSLVSLLHFGSKLVTKEIVPISERRYTNLVWANNGAQLVFLSSDAAGVVFDTLCYYRVGSDKLYYYATVTALNWPKELVLDSEATASLAVSKDGTRVFFMMKKRVPMEDLSDLEAVQIWDGFDGDLYLYRQRYGHDQDRSRLACWWPDSGRFLAIGSATRTSAFLTGNQDYALVYDATLHQPTTKYNPDRDYYLMDLSTGVEVPFLMSHSESREHLLCSPAGKYISYFKNGNWWVYSLYTKEHRNLTEGLPVVFYDETNDQAEEARPYGNVGWTRNDSSILLYDRYGVWGLTPDGKQARQLTQGRRDAVTFRFLPDTVSQVPPSAFYYITDCYDLSINQVLQVASKGTENTGYCLITPKGKLHYLAFERSKASNLLKAACKPVYVFQQESFDCPPQVVVSDVSVSSKKVLFRSNQQHYHYGWGKSELVDYTTAAGKSLQGVLFYPFDYDATQRYGMVVSIYERQTHTLHNYTAPSLLNASGLNKTILCSKGYFVFYPDIVYEVGQPGFSAVDCVLSGTKAVLALVSVDSKRIGLIGHSYGGYETNFIITQTNFFKAAVSGSSVSDLTSGYLSLGLSYAKTDYWRYENEQLRMAVSLFDDWERYHLNSPITYADKISTPLLLWTGENDRQVNPFQTMEFYLALRKLKKVNCMLVYPKEGHVLIEEKHQIDLTNRILNWFDYYLK